MCSTQPCAESGRPAVRLCPTIEPPSVAGTGRKWQERGGDRCGTPYGSIVGRGPRRCARRAASRCPLLRSAGARRPDGLGAARSRRPAPRRRRSTSAVTTPAGASRGQRHVHAGRRARSAPQVFTRTPPAGGGGHRRCTFTAHGPGVVDRELLRRRGQRLRHRAASAPDGIAGVSIGRAPTAVTQGPAAQAAGAGVHRFDRHPVLRADRHRRRGARCGARGRGPPSLASRS